MLLEFFPYTFYYYSTIFDIINKSGFNPCEHLLPLFSVSVRRLSFITDSVPPNSVFIRRCFLQYTTCKKRLLQHPPSKGLSKKCCLKKAPSERICRKKPEKIRENTWLSLGLLFVYCRKSVLCGLFSYLWLIFESGQQHPVVAQLFSGGLLEL